MSPNPARSQRPHSDGLGGEGLFEAQALSSLSGAVREVSVLFPKITGLPGPPPSALLGCSLLPALPLAPASAVWE